MPLWLIYGAEYIMALALLVISLTLLGWLCGYVHFLAVDHRICGTFVTHYIVAIGRQKQAKLAVIRWVVTRAEEEEAGYRRLAAEIKQDAERESRG